ncbi:hypothetical protein [Phytoactinopolyspora limicola]|uniref:hypothetical protein n=1 Tax=Phytoactinopolyspora limicola TaxID=2715536 RepID=UPI00140BE09B|nr:hypothetical protein [Phytoactinopolyspora limicola]
MSQGSELRGFERILTTEVHVSNLLQELTDRDPTPWGRVIGMVPVAADRERPFARLKGKNPVRGSIDLLLTSSEGDQVAIEVKVAHQFSEDQRQRYEASSDGNRVLLGMAADSTLVNGYPRWSFHSLADVFNAWSGSCDEHAALLARMAAQSMRRWDSLVGSVFRPATGAAKLSELQENIMAILVSRRLKHDLNEHGWLSLAGVSSGSSGLALVQGFAALNGDEARCLVAEARWVEGLQQINFRLGVDFSDLGETRETRYESWALAKNMDTAIRIDAFGVHLRQVRPDLGEFITFRGGGGRSDPNDEIWLPVVEHGLKNTTRRSVNPGFVGDGVLRFEASGQIQSNRVDAVDVRDLIDEALKYLCSALPDGYSAPDTTRVGS